MQDTYPPQVKPDHNVSNLPLPPAAPERTTVRVDRLFGAGFSGDDTGCLLDPRFCVAGVGAPSASSSKSVTVYLVSYKIYN